MAELQGVLQQITGTTLDAQGAANVWAGTTGLDLLGALNVRAGSTGLGMAAVLRRLIGSAIGSEDPALLTTVSPNLLSANQASLETDTTGWGASTNATIARSTAQALDGVASLAVTSVAAGDMQAATVIPGVPVSPGRSYTATASYRAATAARSVQTQLFWYTAASVFLYSDLATAAADATTGWTANSVVATAPATAGFARVITRVLATAAAGEVHYVDRISLIET